MATNAITDKHSQQTCHLC